MVIVDARSKWTELEVEKNTPITDSSINKLQKIFSTRLRQRSDLQKHRICCYILQKSWYPKKLAYIAPNFPAINDLAKRNVQTLKRRLKLYKMNVSIEEKVPKIL